MPVNSGLAQVSNVCLLAAIALYAFALLAFAGDIAFGRSRRAVSAAGAAAPAVAAVPVAVGAQAGQASGWDGEVAAVTGTGSPLDGSDAAAAAGLDEPGIPLASPGYGRSRAAAGPWGLIALALTVVGLVAQVTAIASRGFAEHRVPWGNMYEFIVAITCVGVMAFLALDVRYRIHTLGLFVMAPIVFFLGLAATVLYKPAGSVVPALQSYWIAIHVTAMIIAIGAFLVSAVLTILYLVSDFYAARTAVRGETGLGAILDRLPPQGTLDRLSYRMSVFAFPVWTFGVIAGAIWANQAWGHYWSWDPKETWSFITWVIYAGYLHARATAGWRGRKAAYIHLVAFGALLFNVVAVNLWISGLHSYAGMH